MKISLIAGIIVILMLISIGSFFLINKTGDNKDTNNVNLDISSTTENKIIEIKDFTYSQKEMTISVGETVVWINRDSIRHTVTSDSGEELNSQLLDKNSKYSHTFTQAGTFDYHCAPHPYMKGKIIVE